VNVSLPAAETIAKRLITRHETIATAESSTGGLIAAALSLRARPRIIIRLSSLIVSLGSRRGERADECDAIELFLGDSLAKPR
jgi:Competence-damaged protein